MLSGEVTDARPENMNRAGGTEAEAVRKNKKKAITLSSEATPRIASRSKSP